MSQCRPTCCPRSSVEAVLITGNKVSPGSWLPLASELQIQLTLTDFQRAPRCVPGGGQWKQACVPVTNDKSLHRILRQAVFVVLTPI